MRHPKTASLIELCLFILGASTLLASESAPTFKQAELSLEDVISLYNVPVKEKPYYKYEWTAETPFYVRMVIERLTPASPDWIIYETCAEPKPTKKFIFYYRIEWSFNPDHTSFWILDFSRTHIDERIIKEGVLSEKSSSTGRLLFLAEKQALNTEIRRSTDAKPDLLTTFGTEKTKYRIRLEHSQASFPDDIHPKAE